MNKPSRPVARPLRDLLAKVVGDTFTRQGFASAELVTRWRKLPAPKSQPSASRSKFNGRGLPVPSLPGERGSVRIGAAVGHPVSAGRGTGRHRDSASCRGDLRARQSLSRLAGRRAHRAAASATAPDLAPGGRKPDAAAAARLAASLPEIADNDLRAAVARLGAAVKASESELPRSDSPCAETSGAQYELSPRLALAARRAGATFRVQHGMYCQLRMSPLPPSGLTPGTSLHQRSRAG